MSGSGLDLPGVIPFVNKHPESLISHERRPDLRAARPGGPASARAPPDAPRALHLLPRTARGRCHDQRLGVHEREAGHAADGWLPRPEWMGPIDPRLPELRPLIWPNGVRHKAEHPTGLHGTLAR